MIKMTERQQYIRIYSKIAEKRIENNECPVCGKPKTEWNRRTDWRCCSKECTEKFYDEHDKSLHWSWVRSRVFKKDNYTCAMCGERFVIIAKHPDYKGEEFADTAKLVCDHIKPLAMDGEMWDMENLQTLCIECNKKKTAFDQAIIAKYKKIKKAQKLHKTFKKV